MSFLRSVAAAHGAAFLAVSLQAQAPASTAAARPAASMQAVRLQGEVRLDGRLDDAAWQAAQPSDAFTQSYPDPGAAPTLRTEARVLYDDENLYVAVRLHDPAPDSIAAPLARRDAGGIYSDWLNVSIDSRYDRRSAFLFSVNPRGVQRDIYLSDDGGSEDGSWNAVWDVATTVDSAGWAAEFRIPMSQLRFGGQAGDARTWGLQITRDIARRGERASWSPWTRNDAGFVSRFGMLTGLTGVRAPRALEVMPYASARLTRAPGDAEDPFYQENEPGLDAGADLRLGLPAGLTLSATINPDFGQVEADPAEVNLTAFETFFGERRPFFTEGSDVFRFGATRAFNRYGSQEYFYSRRVGRSPQRVLGGAYPFVDAPQQTRILGAAKVSGRTPGGWSIGVMDALTGREDARVVGPEGDRGRVEVEPLSNYFVGRARKDLNGGASQLGILATATNRSLDDETLRSMLHRDAYLGGVDFLHTWGDRAWSVSGYLAGSRVGGEADVLTASQRSSARYYQRPDADYVEVDADRTSLSGHIGELSIAHGGSWDASVQLKEVSPGFEINDVGYQTRSDARSVATFLGRSVNRQIGILRSHSYSTWQFRAWNFGGDKILDGAAASANASFTNFWSAGFQVGARPEYLNDRLTRGGPLSAQPSQWSFNAFVETDSRKPVALEVSGSYRQDASGLRERSFGAFSTLRPSSAVRVQLGPRFSHNDYTAQYVRTTADARATDTYGARYVFGALDQTTFSLETRLDWTFTPRLSLQLYAQPFVSAGSFRGFKELTTPGEFAFARYGADRGTLCRIDGVYVADPVAARPCPAELPAADDPNFVVRFGDPDFNVRSLRGNAVLRWEYRPGSTLFFVWQQERSGFEPIGDFDWDRDTRGIFDGPAHNVFLIKASYWIGG